MHDVTDKYQDPVPTFKAASMHNRSYELGQFFFLAFESDPSTSLLHPFSATSPVSLTHLGVTLAALVPGNTHFVLNSSSLTADSYSRTNAMTDQLRQISLSGVTSLMPSCQTRLS